MSYTLSGPLKDGNNAGIMGKSIDLYWHYAGETTRTYWKTVQTTATGCFTKSDSDTKTDGV